MWVFNPYAQTHCNTPLAHCYRKHELEKKRVYKERVREVEHGTFSPLVFTTAGGLGPTAAAVYTRGSPLILLKSTTRPMGRHCTSSDVDWTSPCEIDHHVSAWLSFSHTLPSQFIVRGHHWPVQCRRQGPQQGLNIFVSMHLTCSLLLLCLLMSPLCPRQCVCVPMYYIMVFVKVTFVAMETSSASSFQLPKVLVDSTVELRFRVVWADASGVLVSFWQMTGVSSLCATYMFVNIEWSYKTKVVV